MKVSLYTGTFNAKLVAGMMKTKKIFINNKADYTVDRDDIDNWTKNQKEKF